MLFLRTKFICIIWTKNSGRTRQSCSWGLSLFVLFEPDRQTEQCHGGSWGLSLFVLFELCRVIACDNIVLED